MEEVTEVIVTKTFSKHEDAAQVIEEEAEVAVDAPEMEHDAPATKTDARSQKSGKELKLRKGTRWHLLTKMDKRGVTCHVLLVR